MNHYQKLAITATRLLSLILVVWAAISIGWWILGALSPSNLPDEPGGNFVFWAAIIYLATGIIVYALSGRIGKTIGRGLD